MKGPTYQSERYARTQCLVTGPEDLPTVHAKHKQRTAAHVAWLAGNQEKMVRLQTWPEAQAT